MTFVDIKIKEFADKTPALPTVKDPKELKLETFVILEKGMGSSRTSVTLHAKDADGKDYLIQTSAALFGACLLAMQGAENRFANRS